MHDSKILSKDLKCRHTVTGSDLSNVRRILETSDIFKPHEIKVALELIEEWIAKGDQSGYYFIFADYIDKPVGYICYGPITMAEQRFDIYWLAVDRSVQSQGIGSLLLTEAEKKIAEADGKYIFIDTSSKDAYKQARNFYSKHGYREVARIPHYYADNDDKVMLMKDMR